MLADLTAGALQDASRRRESVSFTELENRLDQAPPVLNARDALGHSDRVKIIAEIKRASPSRGDLASIDDPVALAQIYESHGASAISVLTEERKFKGSLADLEAVRAAVDTPLLRKDFIAEEYQILEARIAGADIVLLIVAALDDSTLRRLHAFAQELGMAVLVETHSAEEVSRALACGADIVGVNARSLDTFELDRNLFASLATDIPENVIKVAESAVRTAQDVAAYRNAGADVVLVGEALVTNNPAHTLAEFLAVQL